MLYLEVRSSGHLGMSQLTRRRVEDKPSAASDYLLLHNHDHSMTLRCGSFLEKTSKKSTCAFITRIMITFSNQIFL